VNCSVALLHAAQTLGVAWWPTKPGCTWSRSTKYSANHHLMCRVEVLSRVAERRAETLNPDLDSHISFTCAVGVPQPYHYGE
jgi:hypothetical protein